MMMESNRSATWLGIPLKYMSLYMVMSERTGSCERHADCFVSSPSRTLC